MAGFPCFLSGYMTPQNNSLLKRIWRYGPLVLWLLFIWFASTNQFSAANTSQILRPLLLWFFPNMSEDKLLAMHFLTRKLAHFSEYALLAFLARRAFISSRHAFLQRNWFPLALFLVAGYALLDEFHQSFVPERTASIYDSLIDFVGGLTLLLFFRFVIRRRERVVSG